MRSLSLALSVCFTLVAAGCGGSGDSSELGGGPPPPSPAPAAPQLKTFQAAFVALGQPTFNSNLQNQGGLPSLSSVSRPAGVIAAQNGRLYVADTDNHRILGFSSLISAGSGPTANILLGQASPENAAPGTSQTSFRSPVSIASADGMFAVADRDNNRVLLYQGAPASGAAQPAVVIGQGGFTTSSAACGAGMNQPTGVWITDDGKLLVSDSGNHRVLVWNVVQAIASGQAADVILGQNDPDVCVPNAGGSAGAATLHTPMDVWSDGTRVVVADSGNNRVLIWSGSGFPTQFASANRVLGQTSLTSAAAHPPSSSTFNAPRSVASDGNRVAIADPDRNRVLVWSGFPAGDGQAADAVIGQETFTNQAANDTNQDGTVDLPSAKVLSGPQGVRFLKGGAQMFVADRLNNRVLLYRDQ